MYFILSFVSNILFIYLFIYLFILLHCLYNSFVRDKVTSTSYFKTLFLIHFMAKTIFPKKFGRHAQLLGVCNTSPKF